MKHVHFQPKLRKRRVLEHADYTIYAVNGFAVRDVAKPDEEFGNFATLEDFPDLIPKGEIWISEKLAAREGIFFIANCLTQLHRRQKGISEDRAYDDGLEIEPVLREKLNGVQFRDGQPHKVVPNEIYVEEYLTLPDRDGPVKVWVVDGNLVRSFYKLDYTEGGHGYVYPWVPKSQIWVEDGVDRRELPYITAHEYIELRLMRDAHLGYDRAHEACSAMEFDLRKRAEVKKFLAGGSRKIHKKDLPKLTSADLFSYVRKHYANS